MSRDTVPCIRSHAHRQTNDKIVIVFIQLSNLFAVHMLKSFSEMQLLLYCIVSVLIVLSWDPRLECALLLGFAPCPVAALPLWALARPCAFFN